MAHVISAWLRRLVARIQAGPDRANQIAARYGWQCEQVRPGTWRYRDPRFDRLALTRAKVGRRS
jgi:hypothetical protein